MQDELIDVVTLYDEEGNEVDFDHLLTFNYLGKKYMAMMPLEELDGFGPDEVFLMEIVTKDGEDSYVPIESEVLLQEVFDEFLAIFEEYIEEDPEEE